MSILQQACEKQCHDRANQSSICVEQHVLRQGRCSQQTDTVSCAQLPSMLNCCLVIAVVWAHSEQAWFAVGKKMSQHTLGRFRQTRKDKKIKRNSDAPRCPGSCRQGCAKAWQTARCGAVGLWSLANGRMWLEWVAEGMLWRAGGRFGGLEGWQTSLKNRMLWPEWLVGAALNGWQGRIKWQTVARVVPGVFCDFEAWQTARLNVFLKTKYKQNAVAGVARGSCREGLARAYQMASCGPSGAGRRFGILKFGKKMLWPEWLVGAAAKG